MGRLEMVRLLVEDGAEVDLQDHRGFTALMHAAVNGLPKIAKWLLDAGARQDLRDSHGRAALILTQDITCMVDIDRRDLTAHFLRTEASRFKVYRMLFDLNPVPELDLPSLGLRS